MSNQTVRHLDLDAVLPPVKFTLQLRGVTHELQETDVETYLANIRDIEKLSLASGVAEETELSIRIVMRAFPTIDEEVLRKLKISQLQAIIDFARGANNETEVPPAAEGDEANPPSEAG